MLSGLLECAEEDNIEDILRQEIGSNSQSHEDESQNDPLAALKKALYCGFCSRGHPYLHQSSLDRHIQDCALENGHEARHWRRAGWKPENLRDGFTWEGKFPKVKPERICPHCKKVFAHEFQVFRHVTKLAKTWSDSDPPRWLTTASDTIRGLLIPRNFAPAPSRREAMPVSRAETPDTQRSRRYICGFCSETFVASNENQEDQHLHKCARKHNYVAKHWKMAGWLPGTPRAQGLIFDGDLAKVHPDRICPTCDHVFKNDAGLERHLKIKCPPERSGRPERRKPERTNAPQVVIPAARGSTHAPPGSSLVAIAASSATVTPKLKPPERSPEIDVATIDRTIEQLQRDVNAGPPPEVRELLIELARRTPNARAVPGMPLRPRNTDSALSALLSVKRDNDTKRAIHAVPAPSTQAAAREPSSAQVDWNSNGLSQDCSQCGLVFYPVFNTPNGCARHPGVKRIRAGEGAIPSAEYDVPALQARFYWDYCGKSGDSFGCQRAAHQGKTGTKRKEMHSHKSMPGYMEWMSR